jgi:hypothetical protein
MWQRNRYNRPPGQIEIARLAILKLPTGKSDGGRKIPLFILILHLTGKNPEQAPADFALTCSARHALSSAQIIIIPPPQYTSKHWAKKYAMPPFGQDGVMLRLAGRISPPTLRYPANIVRQITCCRFVASRLDGDLKLAGFKPFQPCLTVIDLR